MGFSFAKLRQSLENKQEYNVLVTILTDGEENASKEYNGAAIKKLIDELKLNRWTFTYIGTDHDVEKFASSIGIINTMAFDKSASGIKAMLSMEKDARHMYSQKIRAKDETTNDFYGKVDKEKDPIQSKGHSKKKPKA